MKPKNLFKNEKGLSPVFGVILMVAITVILAAVIAAFVFGLGEPNNSPEKQTTVVKSINNYAVTVTFTGNDRYVLKGTGYPDEFIDISKKCSVTTIEENKDKMEMVITASNCKTSPLK